jgi:hypothetical protein
LLHQAEGDGYDVFITTDQNLRYQQNLSGRRLGIVVLMSASWPRTRQHIPAILAAVNHVLGGGYEEVPI